MGVFDNIKSRIPFFKDKTESIYNESSNNKNLDSLSGTDDLLKTPGLQDIPDSLADEPKNSLNDSLNQTSSNESLNYSNRDNKPFDPNKFLEPEGSSETKNESNDEKENYVQEILLAKVDSIKAKVEVLEHKIDRLVDLIKKNNEY